MPTILWTGFEPWGEHPRNPSWDWIADWQPTLPAGWRLLLRALPVSWKHAWPLLQTDLEQIGSDLAIVLCGGLAARRTVLTPERFAHNRNGIRRPDNDGACMANEVILSDAPERLEATLPVDALTSALQLADLPARVSEDAGDYLCNHLSFRLLQWASTAAPEIHAGFLHVPPTEYLTEAEWSLAREIILETLLVTDPRRNPPED